MTQKFTISLVFSVILSGVIYLVSKYGPIPEAGLLLIVIPFVFFFVYFYLNNKVKNNGGNVAKVLKEDRLASGFWQSFFAFLMRTNIILVLLVIIFVLYRLVTNGGRIFDSQEGILSVLYLIPLEIMFLIFFSAWRIFIRIISRF